MTFNRKIKQIKNKGKFVGLFLISISILILILAIIELFPKDIQYTEFNKIEKSSNYSKTLVYYLMGPLIQIKDPKDNSISGYYIAVGKDKELFIVRLNEENIEIPIVGKNLDEQDIDKLNGIEISGNVQLTSSNLRGILIKKLNILFNEELANNENFEKVVGAYHLDTVYKLENNGKRFLILSAFLAIMGILYLLLNRHIRKNVNQSINELQLNGQLNNIIKEFDSGKLIDYKKLNVYLSHNYIFSCTLGFVVIAFKDIRDVNVSKKMVGNSNRYIIITTKDDKEYYIAPIKKGKQKVIFNELLTKIKKTIE